MTKLDLPKFKPAAAKAYDFFMMPKVLFENSTFDDIDCEAKVLYSFMLNRSSLSAKNPEFVDEEGYVYIIYTVEQVMQDLKCSNKTAVKMFAQLSKIGLIERKIRGLGKPAIIYVKDFSTVS